jgi:preprotein translocase subunit YajC
MANGGAQFIIFALMIAFFYFLIIRPQRRRIQAQQSLQRALQLGDEIVTIGGFHAVIRRFDGEVVTVELAPGVEARINRGAIARRVEPELPEAIDEPAELEAAEPGPVDLDPAERADDRREGRAER